jgi:hypothetical protein
MTKAIIRDQHRKHIYQKTDFLDKAYLSPDREQVLEWKRTPLSSGNFSASAGVVGGAGPARGNQQAWRELLGDMLLKGRRIEVAHVAPSQILRLKQAVALKYVAGPEMALAEDEELARDLEGAFLPCHLWRIAA